MSLMVSHVAFAYVRTTSDKSGVPVQWNERCIVVRPDARGSQDVPLDQLQATLDRAVLNWTTRTLSCGYLLLESASPIGRADVGIDGRPTLVFRDQVWARPGSKMPHDPGIIALTTVFYVNTPGFVGDATILDADIELNGVNYTFTTDPVNGVARPGTDIADLENTLTHELGHVQGLAHTCWDHIKEVPPLDNTGQPIPDCNGPVPDSILQTTMYPYPLTPRETSKRHLSQDDVDGVCDVYPISAPPPACHQEIDGGCAIAHGAPLPFGVLVLLLALMLRRRRC
jgi:uncharacterized protein (TIGR03382 family)